VDVGIVDIGRIDGIAGRTGSIVEYALFVRCGLTEQTTCDAEFDVRKRSAGLRFQNAGLPALKRACDRVAGIQGFAYQNRIRVVS